MMYFNGTGVAADEIMAVIWIRKAAEQGFAQAQNQLIEMYDSEKWIRKAAERGNNTKAQNNLGWMYDIPKAAEQGNAKAQTTLGFMYDTGDGVSEDDSVAVFWYRKAAEQGDVIAQYNLGLMYFNGEGVAADKNMAVFWYRKAAEQELAQAQNKLIEIYDSGNINVAEAQRKDDLKAPDFTLQTLTGERFNLYENLGKPIFLNFWATWCSPCVEEMPDIEKLQQTLGDSILIVGIDQGESAETVQRFVQGHGFTWTFVLDLQNEVGGAYNVNGIPASFFIDAEGRIVRRYRGSQSYETFLAAARQAIGN